MAQPPLPSGFSAVIKKEYDLQAITEGSLRHVTGHHSAEIDRILRHQQSRLSANIALLDERYEALPGPERLASRNERHQVTNPTLGFEDRDESQVLPDLVTRHACLQTDIEGLIERAPDGQRGKLILREVSRNHEEMAWMMRALLKEDATSVPMAEDGGDRAPRGASQAEESWDNEGGPTRSSRQRTGLVGPPGSRGLT